MSEPAFGAIDGPPREEALAGDNLRNWPELIVEDDRGRAKASIDRVRNGERVTFATGYDRSHIAAIHRDVAICEKPVRPNILGAALFG